MRSVERKGVKLQKTTRGCSSRDDRSVQHQAKSSELWSGRVHENQEDHLRTCLGEAILGSRASDAGNVYRGGEETFLKVNVLLGRGGNKRLSKGGEK